MADTTTGSQRLRWLPVRDWEAVRQRRPVMLRQPSLGLGGELLLDGGHLGLLHLLGGVPALVRHLVIEGVLHG